MFARRLAARARFVRPLSTTPAVNRWRGFLQIVGRVSLVSVVAGPCALVPPTSPLTFSQRPARSTTSPTRNAILAHNSPLTLPKRRLSSSAAVGVQRVSSNISTLKITTPYASLLGSGAFSHVRLDRYQSKELFPLHPPPPLRRSRHPRPTLHSPAYVFSLSPDLAHLSLATRFITRHKAREVAVIEAEATDVDVRPCSLLSSTPHLSLAHQQDRHLYGYVPVLFDCSRLTSPDSSPLRPLEPTSTIHYDYLVYAVGAETQTFGIPGVKENACFMKEIVDAEQVRTLHHTHPFSQNHRCNDASWTA